MTVSGAVLALALSSSTGVMSAAVGPIGAADPLAAVTLPTDRRHAEEISPLIQKLLADSGVTLGDLDVLIVDRGPGRFTGLRVGLATIKTLAFALAVPVVGLTSLEILAAVAQRRSIDDDAEARSAPTAITAITAVIDARRNEVFQQRFGIDLAPVGEPSVGPAAELAARAEGIVVGDGL
ncbi:MAG: tRNA (adenosine(37)-N6)-threonylcarbamoyltransferase complex dimerization subunit type 1 TsaB, partial [Acidimicrobiia bacterium]|nr:tRNA (adenosine(37)-N6)-threonylcarbamoyltransferase complex dimerization subunit type 1 TsaB [Acidimicrobiia bacterium]